MSAKRFEGSVCLIDVSNILRKKLIQGLPFLEYNKMDLIDPNHPKFEAFQKAVREALAKRLRDADEELAK